MGIATDGNAFRGKVYAEFFEKVLNVDLYQDHTNQEVLTIASQLENLLMQMDADEVFFGVNYQEVLDLFRAFEQYGIDWCPNSWLGGNYENQTRCSTC